MTSIQELIDKELAIREEHTKSMKFSPSLLGACYRRQWWNRKNEPISDPVDARTQRVFHCGDLFHDFVQQLLIKNNPEIKIEQLVETDDFKGYADIVNGEEVSDIKSVHSKAFWYMSKTEDIKKDKYNNWLQVAFYAKELKKNRFRLVFVSKDDLCIQEFYDTFDDGYWLGELDMEQTKLMWYWNGKTLPPKTPRLYGVDKENNPKECQYCAWKTKCKEMADDTKQV